MNKRTLFMSDMHLCAATPDLNDLFIEKLREWAGEIDALYLLGDIFDVWVGDDDDDPVLLALIEQMHAFSQQTPLFVLRGNRDFLLGKKFAQASGAKMLDDDPALIDCYGTPLIVSHGDIFCTADVEYQKFRRQSRKRIWQMFVLMKSLAKRRMLATHIRDLSQHKKSQAANYEISDVTEQGLNNAQNKFSGSLKGKVAHIIHGHTHRPAVHTHTFENQEYQRFVLPDWHNGHGGAIQMWSNNKIELIVF